MGSKMKTSKRERLIPLIVMMKLKRKKVLEGKSYFFFFLSFPVFNLICSIPIQNNLTYLRWLLFALDFLCSSS